MKMPSELIQAIKQNKLILFAGAGLSFSLKNKQGDTLGGWGKLVLQILLHLESHQYDVEDLLPMARKGKREPIKILDLIESDKDLPRKKIFDFLKEFLDLSPNNDFTLHKKLYQLSHKIITTNYDRAFELSEDRLRKNTAYKGRNYELTKHKDPDSPLLFKLHGCYEGADSMVLFPSQYKALYENDAEDAEHSLLVLKNIILNKTILFIGCGMGDYQINSLFTEIRRLQGDYNQSHFIITKELPDSKLDFLKPILINDFAEIPTAIDLLLEEKKKVTNQKTPEVLKLEQELEATKIQLAKYEKQTLEKDELIEKAALYHFSRGLQLQLDQDYEKASKEYAEAITYNSKDSKAFYNWGNALVELAELQNDPQIYQQSFEKYKHATQIKENYHEAFNNWGIALADLAELQNDPQLYQQSFKKYERATHIKKDKHETFNNWGIALAKLAELQDDPQLYQLSFKKYEHAIHIEENYYEAFYNWGIALLELAKLKNENKLFLKSIEKSKKAMELGGGCYNLACAYALIHQKTKALYFLKQSLQTKEITFEHVKADSDWSDLIDDPDFRTLLQKMEQQALL